MKPIALLRRTLFVLALVPAILLAAGAFTGGLSANPIEYVTHQTGSWALACLVASLAITPIRRLTGWHEIIRLRRMFGLFAFFYASVHFLTWFVFDHALDPAAMIDDVAKRPYITVGMTALVLLVPLAVTSSAAMIRRLGRLWQQLHRLAYAAAIGGVVHYWWLVKADTTEPRRRAVLLAVLLGLRVWWMLRARRYSRS